MITEGDKKMPAAKPFHGARIDLQNVRKGFRGTGPVVETLNLSIKAGEFVALLGPSGCGKSTLLRMIADLDSPDEGRVSVDASGRRFFRGFVFQEAHLLPWRTALANAALPLELVGRTRDAGSPAAADVREILTRLGLGQSALDRYPSQLSGGMKMRVSLARALVTEPSLLLLDEPFSALDEINRHRLQEDLRRLWLSSGMTIVFVTHSLAEAVFLADRIVVLSPRPASVVLDRVSELPVERDSELRMSMAFVSEIQRIQSAISASGVS